MAGVSVLLAARTHGWSRQDAFENAIHSGVLSDDPRSPCYAGRYMYMFTDPVRGDAFKHQDTRHYIYVAVEG